MKKLPEVNVSFEELYRVLVAPIQSKLLLTGIELKVFNQLSEPASADAVADAIGSHLENTGLFLDGLAASNLITKKNGLYQNTNSRRPFSWKVASRTWESFSPISCRGTSQSSIISPRWLWKVPHQRRKWMRNLKRYGLRWLSPWQTMRGPGWHST